eukprot:TRINITY_DN56_c0_g1_i2.p1 TRINITY_DN56_c0_g1~~TRINITY_DN56_c0_g1_i2.p1  ORF type:complete len:853 (-),score=235.81 TRINITY_DN56_c0_g1_i2:111-2669(-)
MHNHSSPLSPPMNIRRGSIDIWSGEPSNVKRKGSLGTNNGGSFIPEKGESAVLLSGNPFLKGEKSKNKEQLLVNGYQLGKTIGKGSFSKVKLSSHTKTGEKVAIKCLRKDKMDEDMLKMVERELFIMKLLKHPNIISLFEIQQTDNCIYLIMEYASGGEIMDFIVAHGRLQEKEARKFFIQLINAVKYMHSMHACHRDLKAANLLLDENLNIKIIDFGFSNMFVPGSKLNTFCGSPTHVSPQLARREEYDGPAADIWSLGVILFNLVTGYLPFEGDGFADLFKKIIAADFTVPSFVPEECKDLIEKMLVVDPIHRYTIADIEKHNWVKNFLSTHSQFSETRLNYVTKAEDIDENIMDHLELDLGFDYEAVKKSLLEGKSDYAATAYYLLSAQKRRKNSHPLSPNPIPNQKPINNYNNVAPSTPLKKLGMQKSASSASPAAALKRSPPSIPSSSAIRHVPGVRMASPTFDNSPPSEFTPVKMSEHISTSMNTPYGQLNIPLTRSITTDDGVNRKILIGQLKTDNDDEIICSLSPPSVSYVPSLSPINRRRNSFNRTNRSNSFASEEDRDNAENSQQSPRSRFSREANKEGGDVSPHLLRRYIERRTISSSNLLQSRSPIDSNVRSAIDRLKISSEIRKSPSPPPTSPASPVSPEISRRNHPPTIPSPLSSSSNDDDTISPPQPKKEETLLTVPAQEETKTSPTMFLRVSSEKSNNNDDQLLDALSKGESLSTVTIWNHLKNSHSTISKQMKPRIEPQSKRAPVSEKNTSLLSPNEIMVEIGRVLKIHGITYTEKSAHLVKCENSTGIEFELEICKLPRLAETYFVRPNRLGGDEWVYKKVISLILNDMQLNTS